MLNRGNRAAILAAVAATRPTSGCVAADVGFEGGAGLSSFLDQVGAAGVVHGIEISETMIAQAPRLPG